MKPADKAVVMEAFKEGMLQLLVATTVIEVGVDVLNASLMIIGNPERLGLAQLHQLRGRVGRGGRQLTAFSTTHRCRRSAASGWASCAKTSDGFVIAEKDLELRGPGEMLGTRQTGLLQFKVADLMRATQTPAADGPRCRPIPPGALAAACQPAARTVVAPRPAIRSKCDLFRSR